MAKKKAPEQKFMRHAGSVKGSPDLSSRRGFASEVARAVGKRNKKAEPESPPSPNKRG